MDGHEVVGSPEAVARRPAPLRPALAAHLHSQQRISRGPQSFNGGPKRDLSFHKIDYKFFARDLEVKFLEPPVLDMATGGHTRTMDGHNYTFYMMKIFHVNRLYN